MKTFPRLFKRTSTGAIQFWDIFVRKHPVSLTAHNIVTIYGQLDTDSPQTTVDAIAEGKNIGKANETTPKEQAEAEAQAKWEKKKKSGYVENMESAQAGEVDELIEGGVNPMLAFTFEKQGKKVVYPCYSQAKLDGHRMIAVLKNGKCTLWSRTRKPVLSLPHIVKEIEANFTGDIVFDGEAYNHSFKDNFEHITHLVRQQEPDAQCTDVQYHVYDMATAETYEERAKNLFRLLNKSSLKYLKFVETVRVLSEDDVAEHYNRFKSEGYEGCMLRNANGLYVGKRSADLIKVKEMLDEEFEIIGVEEGRGKLTGHVGAFICKMANGNEFKAKMSGATEKLKEYFDNPSLWQGKLLTVQFQDLTSYGIPRFPVGLRIREDI